MLPRFPAGSVLPGRAARIAPFRRPGPRPGPERAARALGALLLAAVLGSAAPVAGAAPAGAPARPTLAILDPVDMGPVSVRPSLGDRLRILFLDAGRFTVLPREEQAAKLREYNLDPGAPCKEFQCGFDAGSVLQADYVLFGTTTDLGALYSYTYNLLHMATSQVVHSEVGEVAKRNGGDHAAALMGRLETVLRGIDPGRLSRAVRPKQGLMAVLDLSEGSAHSRAMAERVQTHAYASRRFDLMGQAELEDLLQALEIDKSGITPTDSNMLPIGDRLGVSHLVFSRLAASGSGASPVYRFHLALYDVRARRKLREWPAASKDFRKLLQFEDRFFSTLTADGPLLPKAEAARGPGPWRIGFAVLGLAAGGAMGWMAWEANREAEREYALSKRALGDRAVAAHRERTEQSDRLTLVFGSLGAASLGLSLALVTF